MLTEIAFLPRLVLATEVAATLGDRSSKLGPADRYGRMGAAQWCVHAPSLWWWCPTLVCPVPRARGRGRGRGRAHAHAHARVSSRYALMLMVLDLGGAISLQLTAPLVAALGITYGAPRDFSGFTALPELIVIQAACNGLVLLVLAVLWFAPWCARKVP